MMIPLLLIEVTKEPILKLAAPIKLPSGNNRATMDRLTLLMLPEKGNKEIMKEKELNL